MHMLAFDSHKRYTVASVQNMEGQIIKEARINHGRGNIVLFLAQWDKGSPVAVETIGNWYWIVEEIEQAQMRPRLVHARKAKLMLGMIRKRDRVSKTLLDFGARVQYSVFECILDGKLLEKMTAKLSKMISDEDSVRIYALCAKFYVNGQLPPEVQGHFSSAIIHRY